MREKVEFFFYLFFELDKIKLVYWNEFYFYFFLLSNKSRNLIYFEIKNSLGL